MIRRISFTGCQMCKSRKIKCDETKPACNQCAKGERQCPGYTTLFPASLDKRRRSRTGCQMCKSRRIKCDETKPACNQCANGGRKCPGYMPQKITRRAGKGIVRSHDEEPEGSKNSTSLTSPASGAIYPPPQMCVEDQAASYFVSNFVLIPPQGSVRGFMEYLTPLMTMEKIPQHFIYAFDACAITSFNNRVRTGNDFERKALQKYVKALSTTCTALQDPEVAKQDATLASVLLLSLFEIIAGRRQGMLDWVSHIEGAIQLAKARGGKQLCTQIGLSMFIDVRFQVTIRGLSIPKSPANGVNWWIYSASRDKHESECQRLSIIVGELHSKASQLLATPRRSSDYSEKVMHMIERCQAHDIACVNWSKKLPDYFHWKIFTRTNDVPASGYSKAEVYPGRIDSYQDLWIAGIWNMFRWSRIVLASVSVRCIARISFPTDYRETPAYATARRTCIDLITDTIASVPYQLGWFSKRKNLHGRANISTLDYSDDNTGNVLGGYLTTGTLGCILSQDFITNSQRTWVKGRLEYIGTELGVRQAHILSQMNVRVPSMLIRRDELVAKLRELSSPEQAFSSTEYSMNPVSQWKATQEIEFQMAELVRQGMGVSGKVDELVAKMWLQL